MNKSFKSTKNEKKDEDGIRAILLVPLKLHKMARLGASYLKFTKLLFLKSESVQPLKKKFTSNVTRGCSIENSESSTETI